MFLPDKDEIRVVIVEALKKQAEEDSKNTVYHWANRDTEIEGFFDLDAVAKEVLHLIVERHRKMVVRLVKSDPKGFMKVGMAVMQAIKEK